MVPSSIVLTPAGCEELRVPAQVDPKFLCANLHREKSLSACHTNCVSDHVWELSIPRNSVWILQRLLRGLGGTFRGAISQVVVRGGGHVTNAEFVAKQLPQFTGEARVTILNDAPREAIKATNVPKLQSAVSSTSRSVSDRKN